MSREPAPPPGAPSDAELQAAIEALRLALTDQLGTPDDDLRCQLDALADGFLRRFPPDGPAER